MSAAHALAPPLAALLELTHRCPLQCPYCSNPLELERAKGELSTDEWMRVLDEASELGILQVHFSGGEPAVRRDLPELVAHARKVGLYSNLITSGVTLDQARVAGLAKAGLDHFTRVIALDEPLRPNPARVVSLAPGVIDTDMQGELRASDPGGFPDKAMFEQLKATGQLATPEAAARRVLAYLARADFGAEPVADARDA